MTDRLRAVALACALVGAACASMGLSGGLPRELVATYPPDVQAAYAVFEVRCARCHSLARPLSAQIEDDAHWRAYVAKMRRQPSSGISPEDAETILVFLRHYSASQRVGTKTTTAAEGAR
jgi:mono/diheme cytochrome c family protein